MSKDKKSVAFICHSSIDKERFVLPFVAALREKQGVDAWVDKWEMKPGDKLSRIFDELAKAKVVIPVLSKASVNADWLNAEINSVVDDIVGRSKRIIPVILDGLDKKQFPAILSWHCTMSEEMTASKRQQRLHGEFLGGIIQKNHSLALSLNHSLALPLNQSLALPSKTGWQGLLSRHLLWRIFGSWLLEMLMRKIPSV